VSTNSITTDKLDAPEAGPHAVRDHVSWPLRLDASYNDGRGERACGEISLLAYEGSFPIAHVHVHDLLHRPTGTFAAVNRKRLRREQSVSAPTTTAVGGTAVREAAYTRHPLAVIVRGTTGHVVPQSAVIVRESAGDVVHTQPAVHAKKQEATPMSSSTKATTTAQARAVPQGQAAPTPGFEIGDHVSFPVMLGASYLEGGDPLMHRGMHNRTACGEINMFGADDDGTHAYVDEHDQLHHRTGTLPKIPLDQLRRKSPVNTPTAFVAGNPAPVREAAGMAPYDNLMGTVREAAGTAPNKPVGTPRAMELLDALLTGR